MVIKSNSDKVTKIDSRLFNKPNLLLIFFILTLLILCLLLILEYLEVINIIKPKKNDKNGEDTTKSSEKPVSNIPIDKPVSNIPSDKPINKPIDNRNETKTSLSVLEVLSIITLSLGAILLFYFLFKFVKGAKAFINFFKGYLYFVFIALIMIIIGLLTDIPAVSSTLKQIGLVIILLISLWIFFYKSLKNACLSILAALGLTGLVRWLREKFMDWDEVEEQEKKLKPLEKKLNDVKKNSKLSEELNKAQEKLEKSLINANKLNKLQGEKAEKKAIDLFEKEVSKKVNKEIKKEFKGGLYEKSFQKNSAAFVKNRILVSTLGTLALKGLANENLGLIKNISVQEPNMILFDQIQESNNNSNFSLSDILTSREFGYNKNESQFNSLKLNPKSSFQNLTNEIDNAYHELPLIKENIKGKLELVNTKEKFNEFEKNILEKLNVTPTYDSSIEKQKELMEDVNQVKDIYLPSNSPSNSKYSVIA